MRRKLILVVGGVVGLSAAYVAGYFPEHQRRAAAESQLAETRADLTALESSVRTSRLLGALLVIEEAVLNQNYGQARTRASTFFDDVRAELSRTTDRARRDRLQRILDYRDQVTAGLARGEPAVLAILREIEFQLREALGYEVPDKRPRTPTLAQ